MIDYHELAQLAEKIALEAGRLIVSRRDEGVDVADTKTSPTDVVTRADRESERFIRDSVLAARPHDAVLGEEDGEISGTSGVTWVIDPIDGTVNYLYGIPLYAVSIAAEYDGRAVAGVVVNPVGQETWVGVRGSGAFLDGRALRVNDTQRLSDALVATGFGYLQPRRTKQAEVLRAVLPRVRDIRRAGVAAVDLCWLASGRVDACYERGLNRWDIAAGLLIAEEAGAVVGGLHGAAPSEELVIASAPALFDDLHDLLAQSGADTDAD